MLKYMILIVNIVIVISGIIVFRLIKPNSCSTANVATECFNWKKFLKIFDLGNGVEWVKSIKEIIDLRKAVIYLLIIGSFFAWGYVRGVKNTPIKIDIGYGKEAKINLGENYLYIDKQGAVYLKDKQNNVIKRITVQDIQGLQRKLSPIGLQFEPIAVVGIGTGKNYTGFEAGVGVSFFRYFKMKLDAFLTQKGVYLGTSYKITDNFGVGIGAGKGWKADNRVIIYGSFKF